MAKAKRLLQSGQVHVLRNGFNYIVGHVVGDHGEYDTEVSRDDPNSRAITGWQCTCPWDQYAWQRTRKWKKFEGRPCSHVMALYWKALSTPLDEQLTPEQAEAMGTGQAMPAPAVKDHPPEIEERIEQGERPGKPDTHEFGLPRSFGPEGDINQGDQMHMNLGPDAIGGPPGPAQAPLAPSPGQSGPQPPGVIPPFPGAQMEMQWGGPGTTPGGQKSPPGAYTVPGAKPPSPANPIQNPSTYSHITSMAERSGFPELDAAIQEFMAAHPEIEELRDPQNAWGRCEEIAELCAAFLKERGFKAYAPSDDLHAFDGYQDAQDSAAIGAGDFSYPEHAVVEVYGMYGPNNVNNVFIDFTASQYGLTNEFPKVEGGRVASAQFNAPEVVRLKKPMMGLAEGPVPGQHGDGEYRDVPVGKTGEVVHQDPATGWVEAVFALDDTGAHEPYHVRCYVEPSDIEKTDETNAFIRRQTKADLAFRAITPPGDGTAAIGAFREGQQVGHVSYTPTDDGTYVDVLEAYPQNQGTGTALMNHLLSERGHGPEALDGDFSSWSPEAAGFWSKYLGRD